MTALWLDRTIKPAVSTAKAASWVAAFLALAVSVDTTAFAQPYRPSALNQPFAQLGDWLVEYVPADRQRIVPAYCQATRVFDHGAQLRLVSGGTLYAIDFQGQEYLAGNPKTFELEYWFDQPGADTPVRRTAARLISDGDGVDWIRIEEPNNPPGSAEEMMKSKLLSIRSSIRKDPWQFQIQGANIALDALFECRDDKVLGVPRRAAPVAQPAPQAVPTPDVTTTPQIASTPQAALAPQVAEAPQTTPAAQAVPAPQTAPPPQAAPAPQAVPAPQVQAAPPPLPRPAPFRVPASSTSKGDYCNDYATDMASNTTRALQVRCRGWPASRANHARQFKWCMTKPQGVVDKARAAWSGRLQRCLASQGNLRVPIPVPAPGRGPAPGDDARRS